VRASNVLQIKLERSQSQICQRPQATENGARGFRGSACAGAAAVAAFKKAGKKK